MPSGLVRLCLLPGLLAASSHAVTAEGSCALGGVCAEAEVERAEELEASALRMELLQQRHGRRAVVAVGARQPPQELQGAEGGNLTEVPAEDGNFSDIGPFDEEPDDSEAEHPRPAVAGWEAPSMAAESGWWGRSSFCQTHYVGYFCQKSTRIRCCRSGFFYKECGSTVHSTSCGWNGAPDHPFQPGYPDHPFQPGYPYPGGSHPGWHPWYPPGGYDHFCEEHHIGNFCGHHTTISCCKRGWHYVSCTTTSRSHSYC